jgi:uncharacterized protein (DUF427 family)
MERVVERLVVQVAGTTVADTRRGLRVLETSHPPVYCFPPADVRADLLQPVPGRTVCEFKGQARYFDVVAGGRRAKRAAWCYPEPVPAYAALAGCYSFYAGKMDACWVGDERVAAQAGDFYGGWITSRVAGPFKGGPGTRGW